MIACLSNLWSFNAVNAFNRVTARRTLLKINIKLFSFRANGEKQWHVQLFDFS